MFGYLGRVWQPGFGSVSPGFHMKILPETGLLTAFYYKTGNRPGFPNRPLGVPGGYVCVTYNIDMYNLRYHLVWIMVH
jgi:hypothetical protein